METFGQTELLQYMRSHKLAVVATLGANGPQAALVGVATTDAFEIIFDTVLTSRKHANLLKHRAAAVTFSGPGEQTVQFEGVASPVSLTEAGDEAFRDTYYAAWPDGRQRLSWTGLVYWRIAPRWARYSDFDRGPLIAEFSFGA